MYLRGHNLPSLSEINVWATFESANQKYAIKECTELCKYEHLSNWKQISKIFVNRLL
jgi:hypothetical protein